MTADDSDARLSGDDGGPARESRVAAAYLLIVNSADLAISIRFDAATKLAALDREGGIRAFQTLAEAEKAAYDWRIKAIHALTELDAGLGIDAYRTIARSLGFLPAKMPIVNAVAQLDRKAAAEILAEALAVNIGQLGSDPNLRGNRSYLDATWGAASRLAEWNPEAAIDVLYEFAALPVAGEYRMAAADQIAKLEAQADQPDQPDQPRFTL